ncbi:MAG: hypothetical protein LBT80_01960 [Lactobacillaceae bacterium]|jgi:hypothetical protein|nr:hypothetical protein [Lactobacillaceae bacterium]
MTHRILKTSIAALFTVALFAPATLVFAASGDQVDGTATISLTQDQTALTLNAVPTFSFADTPVTASTPVTIAGVGALNVTDARGTSDSSWTVSAHSSIFSTSDASLTFTPTAFTMGVNGGTCIAASAFSNITAADILNGDTIWTGTDAPGTSTSGATTSSLTIPTLQTSGNYSSTITYSINAGITAP